ncbi:hypothetical protein QO004_006121 [Rhizobium mesoamericanum]|nr:hypothetical protein [Rhizobium mesoamericanum]
MGWVCQARVDAGPETQGDQRSDVGRSHEHLAGVVAVGWPFHRLLRVLKLLFVRGGLPGEGRHRAQTRRLLKQLDDAPLELQSGHGFHLGAKVAMEAAQAILHIENLRLHELARGQ